MNKHARRYSASFKQAAINYMLSHDMSANRFAKEFGLNSATVARWKRDFQGVIESRVEPSIGALSLELSAVSRELDKLRRELSSSVPGSLEEPQPLLSKQERNDLGVSTKDTPTMTTHVIPAQPGTEGTRVSDQSNAVYDASTQIRRVIAWRVVVDDSTNEITLGPEPIFLPEGCGISPLR